MPRNAAAATAFSNSWKRQFSGEGEARAKGISASTIPGADGDAITPRRPSDADRGRHDFRISRSSSFSPERGAFHHRGRAAHSLKQSQGALFASIERRYGVPKEALVAIWGMETGFGSHPAT